MQHNELNSRIPSWAIFLALGALILPITILIGLNTEEWGILLFWLGHISIILMGVGVVLGIIDLIEAHRK